MTATPLVELVDVSKDYRALRPLRVAHLSIAAGEQVALIGPDRPAAEVLVNLITGATVPDRGEVHLFGRPTTAIADAAEWLATIDRVGIVSERAALLDAFSVVQNLAVPFTLRIDPPPDDVRDRAVALAHEVGLPEASWFRPLAEMDAAGRTRVRLARALVLDPELVVFEHPTLNLQRGDVASLGSSFRTILQHRRLAALSLTADIEFAHAIAARVLALDLATGRLSPRRRGWLSRLGGE